MIDRQSAKKKGRWGQFWGKQSVSFQESSPGGVTQDTQQVVTTCGNVTNRGSSFEIQCPGFLLGVGQVNSPSGQVLKSQTPRRKAGAQHKLCCLHEQFRDSELPLSFRVAGTLPSPSSQMPAKGALVSGLLCSLCTHGSNTPNI